MIVEQMAHCKVRIEDEFNTLTFHVLHLVIQVARTRLSEFSRHSSVVSVMPMKFKTYVQKLRHIHGCW
jgi:hypothetical protein